MPACRVWNTSPTRSAGNGSAAKWSVRRAAAAGGISNTYWGRFEDYEQALTPAIAEAVARAFGWEQNWADEVSLSADSDGPPSDRSLRIEERLARVEEQTAEALQAVDELQAMVPVLVELATQAGIEVPEVLRSSA